MFFPSAAPAEGDDSDTTGEDDQKHDSHRHTSAALARMRAREGRI
jgi:hypothetical protein